MRSGRSAGGAPSRFPAADMVSIWARMREWARFDLSRNSDKQRLLPLDGRLDQAADLADRLVGPGKTKPGLLDQMDRHFRQLLLAVDEQLLGGFVQRLDQHGPLGHRLAGLRAGRPVVPGRRACFAPAKRSGHCPCATCLTSGPTRATKAFSGTWSSAPSAPAIRQAIRWSGLQLSLGPLLLDPALNRLAGPARFPCWPSVRRSAGRCDERRARSSVAAARTGDTCRWSGRSAALGRRKPGGKVYRWEPAGRGRYRQHGPTASTFAEKSGCQTGHVRRRPFLAFLRQQDETLKRRLRTGHRRLLVRVLRRKARCRANCNVEAPSAAA